MGWSGRTIGDLGGIGTRAKQRDSSSCENMCISYKYRVFHSDAYLEAMEVKITSQCRTYMTA